MAFRVLPGGTVATSDVAAFRASPQVQPPTGGREALFAARGLRSGMGIYAFNLLHASTRPVLRV
jgi:hypothetical protein